MIVIAQQMGLMGNMLEQYGHLIAFSLEHDVAISQTGFAKYAHHFEQPAHDVFSRYPIRNSLFAFPRARVTWLSVIKLLGRFNLLRWIPGAVVVECDWQADEFDLSDPGFIALAKSKSLVFVRGSWRTRYWSAYEKHIDVIRDFFKIAEPHATNVRKIAEKARKDVDMTIGVHLRQGDLRFDPVRKDFFTTDEYLLVMRKVAALFPGKKIRFLICSDVTQDPAKFVGLDVLNGPGHLVEDMYALAECDFIIGTKVTSFSGWASLMGKKPMYRLVDPEAPVTLADFQVIVRQP